MQDPTIKLFMIVCTSAHVYSSDTYTWAENIANTRLLYKNKGETLNDAVFQY